MNRLKEKLFYYILGGITWSLLIGFIFSASATSYANSDKLVNTNTVDYPIYVNGDKVDVDAYNINGKTYLALADISKETHLGIHWDEENRKVDVIDSSFILIESIGDHKYVDMSYWFNRYNSNQEINGKSAIFVLPFTIDHDSILKYNSAKNEAEVIVGIPMEDFTANNWYLDYDYYLEYVHPLMLEIITENEKILDN